MTKHTNKILERIEKAVERRRGKSRDAGLAALEKRRDEARSDGAKKMLTRHLEQRRAQLERRSKRQEARKAKRAARRTKRGQPARETAAPAFGDLNAKDAIAAVATMDDAALTAAQATENARDKPRTTVLEAMDSREAELSA